MVHVDWAHRMVLCPGGLIVGITVLALANIAMTELADPLTSSMALSSSDPLDPLLRLVRERAPSSSLSSSWDPIALRPCADPVLPA